MARILVTGSTGFVGRHLVPRLLQDGHTLHLANRRAMAPPATDTRTFAIGDIGPGTDWRQALSDCEAVVHLAGQTTSTGSHVDTCGRVNNLGTARLVEQAGDAGVTTFVFLSSIMALVDNWSPAVVSDATPSTATSTYGISKLQAERRVAAFASAGGHGVSLRPPMVYGPDAKGNWHRLHRLAASGLPLPFASITNRRSLISVGNLVDAISRVVHLGPTGQSGTFLVDDGTPVSLPEITTWLRQGMLRPARLIPIPTTLLRIPLRLAGLNTVANSVLGDLVADSARFRDAYQWTPPQHTGQAIRMASATAAPQPGG